MLRYSDSELDELATKNFKSKYLPRTQHCGGWSRGEWDGLGGHTQASWGPERGMKTVREGPLLRHFCS